MSDSFAVPEPYWALSKLVSNGPEKNDCEAWRSWNFLLWWLWSPQCIFIVCYCCLTVYSVVSFSIFSLSIWYRGTKFETNFLQGIITLSVSEWRISWKYWVKCNSVSGIPKESWRTVIHKSAGASGHVKGGDGERLPGNTSVAVARCSSATF